MRRMGKQRLAADLPNSFARKRLPNEANSKRILDSPILLEQGEGNFVRGPAHAQKGLAQSHLRRLDTGLWGVVGDTMWLWRETR